MIVFDLACRACHSAQGEHRFEGWFASSDEFARQQQRGLVTCPSCGAGDVVKAAMAPRLARKGNQAVADVAPPTTAMVSGPAMPPEARAALHAMARMQAEALKQSRWVGSTFAAAARAQHYGERAVEPIHGQASAEEARALIDEGVEIAPILFPLAPPDAIN